MAILLNWKDIYNQSQSVYNQFKNRWIDFAKKNSKLSRENSYKLQNVGLGKFLLCCAMGESLEEHIDIIKKYRYKIDILTCDKGFKPLLQNGIKANYVLICDTNVPYKFIDGVIEETKDVKLLSSPYANIEWTHQWKGEIYFFINKDSIETEKLFLPILGNDTRLIPAGSNVSNAMLIFMTGADEYQSYNFAGYEKYILVGYDYSWRPDGKYYAWGNPIPKRYYMNHRTLLDMNGDLVFTSENLFFSVKWLFSYITSFNLPVVNCSGRGLLDIPYCNQLETELKIINSSQQAREHYLEHFEIMQNLLMLYKKSERLFENSRINLYGRY